MSSVQVRREPLVLPTYLPAAADKNPMFLERRVYQGSSGRVYPVPFTDRVALEKRDHVWDAVYLENEYIRVTILPELGGRIHGAHDKTNGYDFFYTQQVVKPALVGLAGPWVSGGVEFNWPQHHRPSTFMPTDVHIEEHADGSRTVWLSEHDPLNRMKGMHGVCLHPGRSCIEVKVRAYNRTPHVQTFLWWANVATRVHEHYQSFFPEDVTYVADHAKRAMSTFPLCDGHYYGVNYGARAPRGIPENERPPMFVPTGEYAPNDLSWYANIPVPTSYMCMGTEDDFFGGYDHARQAGVVHVANHHIAPGKKQWTWGNNAFGYAWDRHLTDEGGPYIELMAGVYTDNQPDFSYLMPGETKTWSQFWYPIQKIGTARQASVDAAVNLTVEGRRARIGVSVSSRQPKARVSLLSKGRVVKNWIRDLAPDAPMVEETALPARASGETLTLRVEDAAGRELVTYTPKPREERPVPPPATEPPLPKDIASTDELFVTGLHLEQYRHATRGPEAYWREALRRDPGDSRCLNALGRWHLRRGEFAEAEGYFRAAIARLTLRNPNPYDGEPYYNLGVGLRYLGRDDEAYAAFYKAVWNHAWQAAGYHALAEIDCLRGRWTAALDHLDRALRVNTDNLRARDLRALVLRRLGRDTEAGSVLRETLALDPHDWCARYLSGEKITCDAQVRLDLALDFARAGFFDDALVVLADADPTTANGTAPMIAYYRAWIAEQRGDRASVKAHLRAAAKAPPDYCFPARLEEIAILEFAISRNPKDARAPYYLGNLLYDRRRHAEAIACWEKAAAKDPRFPTVWRNLGIGYFNHRRKPAQARAAYERAFQANPADGRVFYERDQLWKRTGVSPRTRLRELERYPALVALRDDLTVELCALYRLAGQPEKAGSLLASRHFQPWEGGEGQVLAQYIGAQLALGTRALEKREAESAVHAFAAALDVPENLGETFHPLANRSEIHYWLGEAHAAAGRREEARRWWKLAAEARGDFQQMSVQAFSEMTYFSARALERLGKTAAAKKLLRDLLRHAQTLEKTEAKIDYFATSLPTMLLFEDDLQARQTTQARFLRAQALLGLGRRAEAKRLLADVLRRDPAHLAAKELAARFEA